MSVRLLDVNALIALMWPSYDPHSIVQEWFGKILSRGWATCPFTQAGFIRIVSNPAFSRDAVSPAEALDIFEFQSSDQRSSFLEGRRQLCRSSRTVSRE